MSSLFTAYQLVNNTLGNKNDYLIKIVDRVLNNNQNIVVDEKYQEIKENLKRDMDTIKNDFFSGNESANINKLIINSILLEKLGDRSQLEKKSKCNNFLVILIIIVPLLTNLFQFMMSYYLGEFNNECTLISSK